MPVDWNSPPPTPEELHEDAEALQKRAEAVAAKWRDRRNRGNLPYRDPEESQASLLDQ